MSKKMDEISIDLGYGSCKISYAGKLAKFSTAVSYATDVGVNYGEDNTYEFEGEKYYVGSEAADSDAFATTDYSFLYKFAPLLIYHILGKFDKSNIDQPIIIKTGLAIVDWDKKEEFKERISKITVNGSSIETIPILIPQGAGCERDWVVRQNNSETPGKLSVIDIGYNTINVLGFSNGKPQRKDMYSYPGHGVSNIIKPFTKFLENQFKIIFSEQEAVEIFLKGSFTYNGQPQDQVEEKIEELKKQFIKKLQQQVFKNNKKMLGMSDVVLIAGGGAYLLQDVAFPPNVKFVENPMEFSNVRGYAIS